MERAQSAERKNACILAIEFLVSDADIAIKEKLSNKVKSEETTRKEITEEETIEKKQCCRKREMG